MSEPYASYCPLDVKSLNYNNRNVMSIKPTLMPVHVFVCLFCLGCLRRKGLHNVNISLSVKIDPNEPFPFHLLSDLDNGAT